MGRTYARTVEYIAIEVGVGDLLCAGCKYFLRFLSETLRRLTTEYREVSLQCDWSAIDLGSAPTLLWFALGIMTSSRPCANFKCGPCALAGCFTFHTAPFNHDYLSRSNGTISTSRKWSPVLLAGTRLERSGRRLGSALNSWVGHGQNSYTPFTRHRIASTQFAQALVQALLLCLKWCECTSIETRVALKDIMYVVRRDEYIGLLMILTVPDTRKCLSLTPC
ncbi:hypothetical protein PHLGIDRAFT_413001 [Phlebiopsis gigantea 11061_1 CR5-6]|uniref:Uncharacterized protein n=1 Tax=Phlebiopsis gigantea (strain 11061_1 CR5-6) TaxID=745531 RepID=A0A0C3SB35_PHLG1|nr:hypothetical protein PHLGIDRAFT_413001 [Phlebiopsis gigantea 11061_1 CR5-6]